MPLELSQRHTLCANLTAFFSRLDRELAPLELPQWRRLYTNLKSLFSRFLALACEPKHFAPLIIDCWLLFLSVWNGNQPGPDFVYPMLGIRKRQSGRLARLVLEHSREQRLYEDHVARAFSRDNDSPCVAIINLNEVLRDVENGYSIQLDLYGLVCALVHFEVAVTLISHALCLPDRWHWQGCVTSNLILCIHAIFRDDYTLTLARRSDACTPGFAVFLDQDFTLVLIGSQNVVEAIAESGFHLSERAHSVQRFHQDGEEYYRGSTDSILEVLCEFATFAAYISFWELFCRSTQKTRILVICVLAFLIACTLRKVPPRFGSFQRQLGIIIVRLLLMMPSVLVFKLNTNATDVSTPFSWEGIINAHSSFLLIIFILWRKTQNYPIRTGKFLDAIGHPPVRKWRFDTLAASATFQCLVICHGLTRPVRDIDVLAFLDMLVLDQRAVWKVWKERVADRIVHEKVEDIRFTPTIPTFPDERQQQLKDLLDQAQLGYDAYMRFYKFPLKY